MIGDKTISSQDFVLVNKLTKFDDLPTDGIVGLAFSELNSNYNTLVQSMVKSGIINSATFSLFLSDNNYDHKDEEESSMLIFGESNLKKYSKDQSFTELNIISSGYWSVILTRIEINDEIIKTSTRTAIIDSSINLLIGPASDVLNVFSKVQNGLDCILSDLLICKCNDLDDFPILEFNLESKSFFINPAEYIYKDRDSCKVLITSARIGAWLLGNPFLRSYYTHFDMDKKKISLARSLSASKVRAEKSSFWTIMLIILSVIVVAIAFALARYYYLKRREARVQPQNEERMIPLAPIK